MDPQRGLGLRSLGTLICLVGNYCAASPALLLAGRRASVTRRYRTGFLWGINSNTGAGKSGTWVPAGVKGDRSDNLDVEYTATPAEVSTAAGVSITAGCRPIIILNSPNGTVLSAITPTLYAEKAVAIIKQVVNNHPGVVLFELINEPYFKGPKQKSNASDYAAICKATYEKAVAEGITGVKLLIALRGEYQHVNSTGEILEGFKHWIKDFAAAWPAGKEIVNGFVVHPYGKPPPAAAAEEEDSNFLTTKLYHEQVIAEGFNEGACNNVYISEFGFNVEPGFLSALLSTGGAITALPVKALPFEIASGVTVTLNDGTGHTQNWTTTGIAAKGATTIAVTSQVPNFAYPATTTAVEAPTFRTRVNNTTEQAANLKLCLEEAQKWREAGWLKGLLVYNGHLQGGESESKRFGIFGDSAQTVYTAFAEAHP